MKKGWALCGILTLTVDLSSCTQAAKPNPGYDALIALSGRALSLEIKTSELKTRAFVEGDLVAFGCLSDPLDGVRELTDELNEVGNLVYLAKKMRDRRDLSNVNSMIGVQISEIKDTAAKYRQYKFALSPGYCEKFPTAVQVATSLQEFAGETSDSLQRIEPIN